MQGLVQFEPILFLTKFKKISVPKNKLKHKTHDHSLLKIL